MIVNISISSVFDVKADTLLLPVMWRGELIGAQEGQFEKYWNLCVVKEFFLYRDNVYKIDGHFSFKPMFSALPFTNFTVILFDSHIESYREEIYQGLRLANKNGCKVVSLQAPYSKAQDVIKDYFYGIYDFKKEHPNSNIGVLNLIVMSSSPGRAIVEGMLKDKIHEIGDEIVYRATSQRKLCLE